MAKGLSYRALTQQFQQGVLDAARRSMKNFSDGAQMPKVGEVHGPRKLPKVAEPRKLGAEKGKGDIFDKFA